MFIFRIYFCNAITEDAKKGQPYSIRRKEIKVLIVLPSFTRRGRLRDGLECWPSDQISSESEPRPQIIQQQPKVVAVWWKFGNRGTSWRCFWSIGSSSCWGSVRVSAVTPSSHRKETDRPVSVYGLIKTIRRNKRRVVVGVTMFVCCLFVCFTETPVIDGQTMAQ